MALTIFTEPCQKQKMKERQGELGVGLEGIHLCSLRRGGCLDKSYLLCGQMQRA